MKKNTKLIGFLLLSLIIFVLAAVAAKRLSSPEFLHEENQASGTGSISFAPMSVRAVNYFPAEHTWGRMWQNFDETAIRVDLDVAKSLNINTLRIFLYQSTLSDFASGPGNQKFDRFVEMVAERNMKLIVDIENDSAQSYYPCTSTLNDTDMAFVESVVNAYKNETTIIMWETTNEPHCGDYGNLPDNAQQNIISVVEKIKSIDSDTAVSVPIYQGNIRNSGIIQAATDVLNFHLYDVGDARPFFAAAREVAGNKPVFIGEFGCMAHPYREDWGVGPARYCSMPDPEGAQANMMSDYYNLATEYNFIGMAPWILSDFIHPEPGTGAQNTPTEPDKYLGLIRDDNTVKQSGERIKALYDRCDNDGVKETGEECDGTDFGNSTCFSFNFTRGNLLCNNSCEILTTQCTNEGGTGTGTITVTPPIGAGVNKCLNSNNIIPDCSNSEADVNLDCSVNINDFAQFIECYNADAVNFKGDYNNDRKVDILDFPEFKDNYLDELAN